MPFDPTGTYTPPAGAESATPGALIKSATWNSIFADIATALTQLGQSQIIQSPRSITNTGNITIATTDTIVLIGASVPDIILPAAASQSSPVTIVGSTSGIFSNHNSVLVSNGSDTIDGSTLGATLTSDFQSIMLLPLSTGWLTK